jgi:hypothetical protein
MILCGLLNYLLYLRNNSIDSELYFEWIQSLTNNEGRSLWSNKEMDTILIHLKNSSNPRPTRLLAVQDAGFAASRPNPSNQRTVEQCAAASPTKIDFGIFWTCQLSQGLQITPRKTRFSRFTINQAVGIKEFKSEKILKQ